MVTTSENRDLNSISEIEKAEAFCYQNFQKQHSHVSQVLERFKHLSVNVPNFDSLNGSCDTKSFLSGVAL